MKNKKNITLPACLWMQAGVVAKKQCYSDFFCATCRFDRAMRAACKKKKFVLWHEKLRGQPLSKRPCIHHMKGHIEFKACFKNYHCLDCEFDQYFHDQFKVHTVVKPVEYNDVNGISLPGGYYLHPGHTWIKIEDNNNVRIGIDDFASHVFGQFSSIKALLTGQEIFQNKPGFKAVRDDKMVEFQSPVNGVVTESNPSIRKTGSLVNKAPYTEGWVMRAHCENLKDDLKQLLFMNDNMVFFEKEIKDLMIFLENKTNLMAADGGTLGNDIYGNAPDLSWDELVRKFINRVP